jgi:hydrogenase maturation protein HypF
MKKTIFATGGDIKNKFLFAKGDELYPGPDIGDLSDAENFEKFKKEAHCLAIDKKIKPSVIAYDLHPGYFSTKFAKEKHSWLAKKYKLIPVQHHHAHIASVMYEYDLKEPVIGATFDGTGYGTDGNIWGGEFLLAEGANFKRLAYLKYRPMPGGDKVISEPWRMVLSILAEEGASFIEGVPEKDKKLVLAMLEKGINSPLTSSAGRLFDAASALLGLCVYASYEAEGPIKLEAMCSEEVVESYKFSVMREEDHYIVDTDGVFKGMASDIGKKPEALIATKFHNSMAEVISRMVQKLSREYRINKIVLSGGVFQNKFLKKRVLEKLEKTNLKIFTNRSYPAGDLNVALGQYYVSSSTCKN